MQHKLAENARHIPHYGLRKLSVGVASVLLSTTLYFGATAHADIDSVNQPDNNPGDSSEEASDDISNQKIQETTVALKTPTANTQQQDTDDSSSQTLNIQSSAKTAGNLTTGFADSKVEETPSVKADPTEYTQLETGHSVVARLADGSILELNNDNLSSKHPRGTLTFTSNNFQNGDTYTIAFSKKGGIEADFVNAAAPDASFGSMTDNTDNSDVETITLKFTNSGTTTCSVPLRFTGTYLDHGLLNPVKDLADCKK